MKSKWNNIHKDSDVTESEVPSGEKVVEPSHDGGGFHPWSVCLSSNPGLALMSDGTLGHCNLRVSTSQSCHQD